MRKLTLCITLCVLVSSQLSAIGYEWYGLANSSGTYTSTDLVYHNDYLYGVCEFDSDTVTIGGNTLINAGNGTQDIFVFKADTLGNVIWVEQFGGTDNEISPNLAVDDIGNVLITGSFKGNGIFGTTTLISHGGYDVFVLKLNNAGNFLWVERIGEVGNDYGSDICSDFANAIYVSANFSGATTQSILPITFAGITATEPTFFASICKFDNLGMPEWFRYIGGTSFNGGTYSSSKVIEYNKADSSVHMLFRVSSNNMSVKPIGVGNYYIGVTPAALKIRVRHTGGTSYNNITNYTSSSFGSDEDDLNITDNGAISVAYNTPLDIGGYSVADYSFHSALNPQNSYSRFDSRDVTYASINYPIITADESFSFVVRRIDSSSSPCNFLTYDIIKRDLNQGADSIYPSKELTSLTNSGENLYIGGDGYIAKACFSACPISSPLIQPLHINPAPDIFTCNGNNTSMGRQYCDYISGGIPPYSFSWSPTTGLNNSTLPRPIVSTNVPMTYYLTVTDAANNIVYDTVHAIFSPPLISNLTLSSSSDTICTLDTVTIYSSFNGNAISHTWSNQNNSMTKVLDTRDSAKYVVNYFGPQSSLILYNLLDSNGCYSHTDYPNLVKGKRGQLNTTSSVNGSVCQGDTVSLTASIAGLRSVSWSGGILNGAAFAAQQSQTYNVTVKDSNACTYYSSLNINVFSTPIGTLISFPKELCQGDSVILGGLRCNPVVDSPSLGAHIERVRIKQNSTIVYSNTTGDGPGDYNIYADTLTLIAGTNYTMEIKRNNLLGNGNIRRRAAWIDYNRDGSFSTIGAGNSQTPQNLAFNFQVPASAANGYTIMRVAGSTNTPFGRCHLKRGEYEDYIIRIVGGQQTAPKMEWSPAALLNNTLGSIVTTTKLYTPSTFTLKYTNSYNCVFTDSINVVVHNLPTVTANNPLNISPYIICPSDSAMLWGSGAQSYTWTGGVNDSSRFFPNTSQTFTVSGIDSMGCIGRDSIELIIATDPLDTIVSYPPHFCQGDSVALGGILKYCHPVVDSAGLGAHIERVRIMQNSTIIYSNSTGDGPGDYNAYVDSLTLQAATSYKLQIKRNNLSTGNIRRRAAWIDYNRDGYFDDNTERIVYGTSQNPQNLSLNFQIPASVANGYTVMRVAGSTNTPLGPCRLRKGEFEDYTVRIIGGQPMVSQFVWSPASLLNDTLGAAVVTTNLYAPSTFTLKYIDTNSCVFVDSITVTPNPLPAPIIFFSGNTLSCTNAPNTATYNWSLNGNAIGTNSDMLQINQNGQYVVEAIDSLGCSGFDTLDVINVGTRDYLRNQTIQLFPNPTSNVFTIQSDKIIKGQVEVLNLLGKRILSEPINTKQQQFELNQIAKGAYIVRITAFDKKRIIYVARLMIK